jgi:hypothetical protein
MTQQAGAATILRVELWHVLLLLATAVTLGQTKLIDLTALLLGGAFMGVNFFFAWIWHLMGFGAAGG